MSNSAVLYVMLFVAIVCEVLSSSFLAMAHGFTHIRYIVAAAAFFLVSSFLGIQILKTMPVGIMYAIWCGGGVILAGVLGYYLNGQELDKPALVGMAFIMVGLIIIYWFSKSVPS